MKRTLLYIGSVFILILSAITFIFVPSMLDRGQGSAYSLGTYKGKKIELVPGTPIANALGNFEMLYKDQLSQADNYPAEQQKYYRNGIYYQMYNNAFNAAVLYLSAERALKAAGYEPSKQAVSRELVPYYSDENGYSARIYNSVSESKRNELKKDVTTHLVWNQYYNDLFGTGRHTQDAYYIGLTCTQNYITYMQQMQFTEPATVGGNALFGLKTSEAEQAFLATMGNTKRSFDMVSWDKSQYPDQEVIMYGVDHYELFNKHDLSVISVDDKAEAEKLLTQITNNEITFDDACAEYSKKYYTGDDGKLTSDYEYQIKEIIPGEDDFNAVIALEKDAISGVIQTANNSYSLFRRNEKRGLNHLNVEENIDVVRNYLDTHEAGIAEEYYKKQATDFAAAAVTTSFDAASRKFDVKKVSDITELNGAATNENFLQTAFSLKNNEVSEPIVLGNRVIVLKLTGEQLDDVSDESKAAAAQDIVTYDVALFQSGTLNGDGIDNKVYEFVSQNIIAD